MLHENVAEWCSRAFVFEALERRFLLSATAAPLASAGGAYDSAFGGGGIASMPTSSVARAYASAVASDGDIVAAGQSDDGAFVARWNPDGSIDTTFGRNGVAMLAPGASSPAIMNLCALPGGKLLIEGPASDAEDGLAVLARLNPDGALDHSFGRNGLLRTSLRWQYLNMQTQEDGKIVLASLWDGIVLQRLLANGAPDTTFGVGGKVVTASLADGQICTTTGGLGILSDGRIVVADSAVVGDDSDLMLAYYGPDGSPLKVTLAPSVDLNFGHMMVLPGDELLVHSGLDTIERFTSLGILDQSFGDGGILHTVGAVADFNCQADGKIAVVGWWGSASWRTTTPSVSRYNPDGTLDTTFGVAGEVYLPAQGEAGALLVLSNGRIVSIGPSLCIQQERPSSCSIVAIAMRADVGFAPPAASVTTPVFQTPGKTLTVAVTFSSPAGFDQNSLGWNDLGLTNPDGTDGGAEGRAGNRFEFDHLTHNADGSLTAFCTFTRDIGWATRLFGPADNGTYTVTIAPSTLMDRAGHLVPGGAVGTFTLDFPQPAAPAVAALDAPDLITPAVVSYPIEVTFRSGVPMDPLSLPWLQVLGPDGKTMQVRRDQRDSYWFSGMTHNADGSTTVLYYVSKPDGPWFTPHGTQFTPADNGVYTVLVDGHITDVEGNPMQPAVAGTFTVNVPPAPADALGTGPE